MKKNASNVSPGKTESKGAFYKAGEIIGSIGFHIVDGKDKAIGAVSDGFNMLKKVIKKKPGKKKKPKSRKIAKKKAPARAARKTTKAVKKTAKKSKRAKRETGVDKTVSKKAGENE